MLTKEAIVITLVLCYHSQFISGVADDEVRAKKGDATKSKNPYYTKFEETAHLRPTRCHGKHNFVT